MAGRLYLILAQAHPVVEPVRGGSGPRDVRHLKNLGFELWASALKPKL